MTRIVLLVVALATLAGCASAIIVPTAADVPVVQAQFPGATLGELAQGRALFVSRCAGCHQLPLPATRSPNEWPRLVDKMAPDAKINDGDKALIERYLVAASARTHRAPAAVDGAIAASR